MFVSRTTARTAALTAVAGLALAATASPAAAQLDLEKLAIHGYLTQGVAASSDHPLVGIPTRVTADYRAAALQFRYSLTEKDGFVLQLNHRRAGVNPVVAATEQVQLGWAYYQRRIGNGSIKVGKAPGPIGLYNETRFVGTLIPLYRAPVALYDEGFETLDGVVVSQRFALADGWSVEANAVGGGFDLSQAVRLRFPVSATQQMTITRVVQLRSDRLYGGSATLETPLRGVRVGATALRFKPNTLVDSLGGTTRFPWSTVYQGSIDASFARGALRGEYRDLALNGEQLWAYYAQGLLSLTEQLQLVGQAEFTDRDDPATPDATERAQDQRDLAVGVRVAVSPNVVFKLEGHEAKGYRNFEEVTLRSEPRKRTTYGIASVSLAF